MNTIIQCSREDLREELAEIYKEILTEADIKAEQKANDQLLTTEEACEILKISVVTLWRWAKSEYLVPIYIGGQKRYRRYDINSIIESKGLGYEEE